MLQVNRCADFVHRSPFQGERTDGLVKSARIEAAVDRLVRFGNGSLRLPLRQRVIRCTIQRQFVQRQHGDADFQLLFAAAEDHPAQR